MRPRAHLKKAIELEAEAAWRIITRHAKEQAK